MLTIGNFIIDLEKAFDILDRDILWRILKYRGIRENNVRNWSVISVLSDANTEAQDAEWSIHGGGLTEALETI